MKTRDKILAAAEQVMRTRGLAQATTKEIARQAGYSEGTLYKHFESKSELFLAMLRERRPTFLGLLDSLPARAGEDSVSAVLAEVARSALSFYESGMPITASIFAEPEMLAKHRREILERGAGPQRVNEAVVEFLELERASGRIRKDADPAAAASLLVGACYHRAFLRTFLGEEGDSQEDELLVAAIVDCLMNGLTP